MYFNLYNFLIETLNDFLIFRQRLWQVYKTVTDMWLRECWNGFSLFDIPKQQLLSVPF